MKTVGFYAEVRSKYFYPSGEPGEGVRHPDWNLAERLGKVPQDVYKNLKKDMSRFYNGKVSRWHTIMNGTNKDMYVAEALMFCHHLGCTIEQLADKNFDLAESVKDMEVEKESDFAKRVGLKKAV
ncbi:MAG: hypothetical protein AAFR61_15250 [Bacteroidota bacterium]